ncbi:hypothetical protein C9I43_12295 [Shewanella morhuae]|uniref:Uncharacterized protein n=1 Tax=Shewanella morhuae TaxID=365591 RepID=A0ABX5HYL3_9GAMM|nr:hypothetical protein C9I43_12295 [Shewanella morhuae]
MRSVDWQYYFSDTTPIVFKISFPEGSSVASMPPTATSVIMLILTNPLTAHSAKKLLPQRLKD